jgi:uncharacterized protein (TIRG00374 family)
LKKNIISLLKIIFFLAIGVFFIWIFLSKLTPDQKTEIWQSFVYADYTWVVFSIIIGICSHIVRALRWNILIETLGYKPKISNTFFAVMIGYLANMALPRLGEVTRCGVLAKYEKVPFNKSFGTVIVERSVDMVVFFALFFLNLIIFFDKINLYVQEKVYGPLGKKFDISEKIGLYLLVFVLAIALVVGLFFILRKRLKKLHFYQKIADLLVGLWHGLWSVSKIKKPWTFVFQSILIWVLYYLMVYLCFFSLPETAHLGWDAALSLLIFGSIGIMVVQGGIGIYPVIIAETLVIYQVASTTGYALGWLIWTAQTLMILIAGVLSLILLPVLNKLKNA